MEYELFESFVHEALETLPPQFARKLENVEIVIEDMPSMHHYAAARVHPGAALLGLYQGIPQNKRGNGYAFVLPDKITIFQKPIEWLYQTPEAVKKQVRKTVLHEIGHHFGMSESEIAEAMSG